MAKNFEHWMCVCAFVIFIPLAVVVFISKDFLVIGQVLHFKVLRLTFALCCVQFRPNPFQCKYTAPIEFIAIESETKEIPSTEKEKKTATNNCPKLKCTQYFHFNVHTNLVIARVVVEYRFSFRTNNLSLNVCTNRTLTIAFCELATLK